MPSLVLTCSDLPGVLSSGLYVEGFREKVQEALDGWEGDFQVRCSIAFGF